jgi:hypothetical protein
MRERRRITITAAAGTALATAAVVASSGLAQDPGPQPTTLELVARHSETRSGFVDAPPRRREGPGDQFTVSSRLRDPSGIRAGRAEAAFAQTSGARAQGSVTFILSAGRVVAAGALGNQGNVDQLAVVGGSGAYADARGSVDVIEGRRGTRFRLTLAR